MTQVNDSQWKIPEPKCFLCGHEGMEDLELRDVDRPGNLRVLCIGCSDKYATSFTDFFEAVREAAHERAEEAE